MNKRTEKFKMFVKKHILVVGIMLFFALSMIMITVFLTDLAEALNSVDQWNTIILTTLSTIVCGTMLIFMLLYWRTEKKDLQMRHQQKVLEQTIQYTETIESMVDDIRRFRHDYKNILTALESYLQEGDLEGIKRFYYGNILELEIAAEGGAMQYTDLKHIQEPALKGLLYIKLAQAQNQGVNVKLRIDRDINISGIPPVDLCRLLGILIDNAIEASADAMKEEKPGELHLYVAQEEGNVVIDIVNTYSGELSIQDIMNDNFTTKGVGRGTGLASARKIIDKYPGLCMNWQIGEQVGCSVLIIKNE